MVLLQKVLLVYSLLLTKYWQQVTEVILSLCTGYRVTLCVEGLLVDSQHRRDLAYRKEAWVVTGLGHLSALHRAMPMVS